jgi:uncharacterized protein
MRPWVVNTSPLIFLAKLDRLNLLRKSADKVLVPSAVLREIREQPDEATQRIEQALPSWLEVRSVEKPELVEVLRADLDLGEAEVIGLALQTRAERVVMDDLDGRRFARRLGLDLVGTLGLLLAARLRGELASLQEEIELLRRQGFRISDGLIRSALREAGEEAG